LEYKFIVRRIIATIPTILLTATIIFFVVEILPGDAALAFLGLNYNPMDYETVRKAMGLDKPLLLRYFLWLSDILRGNFGVSLRTGEPVLDLIMERLPVTYLLSITSIIVTIAVGIPAGIISAVKKDTAVDLIVSVLSFFGLSFPGFFFCLVLMMIFSLYLRLLPSSGFVDPFINPVESIKHLILPTTVLGLTCASIIARYTRSSLLEVLMSDYIRTARAKGLRERVVIFKHALKNAMIPVTTQIGLLMGGLLGGQIITESIFALPGLGRLLLMAISQRDYILLEGCALIICITYIISNFVTDITYSILDPRVRYR